MVIRNGQVIQAFPIHHKTKSAVHTDQLVGSFVVARCVDDGSITYTFNDDTTFTETVSVGDDRALGDTIKSITTSTEFMIS